MAIEQKIVRNKVALSDTFDKQVLEKILGAFSIEQSPLQPII